MSEAVRFEVGSNPIPVQETLSFAEQERFFNLAFEESQTAELRKRTVKGPWYEDFHEVMQATSDGLAAIDPRLTPESLMDFRYQDLEMRHLMMRLGAPARGRIGQVKNDRFAQLRGLAATRIAPALKPQTLPEGVLDTPPYSFQGEDWSHNDVSGACGLAAFRMVFGAVAGWKPSEHVVASRLIGWHHSAIVEDDVLAKIFATNAFRENSGKQVGIVDVVGADFAHIGQLTQKLKTGRPDLETYCVLTLGTRRKNFGPRDDILHKVVLLAADEQGVTLHDPSPENGGERLVLDTALVADRWAIAHNSARLFVAQPIPAASSSE